MLSLPLNPIFSHCCPSAPCCCAVQYSPEIRLPRSGDISPDLFKSSAALPPDTLLLGFGSAWQEGRGQRVQATVRQRQSGGQEGRADEKRSEWQIPHLKTNQSLDASGSNNKCMYVRRAEVGWSRATRHHVLMITA